MPLLLLDLAHTLDTAAATGSKLAKQKAMADLFQSAGPADLPLAVRYANGRPFPSTDERVLGVSSATVSEVILELLRLDPAVYRQTAIRKGEIGEAIAELWPAATDTEAEPELTLQDLAAGFDKLAATTLPAAKKPVVYGLFARCVHPREACYLAKIILSDMRTGVKEGVLQAAVAQAFGLTLADVQRGMLFLGDLDDVARLASERRLHEARFTLFHPLQFMLANPIESAAEAPGDWIIEDKLDGIRAQAHKSDGRTAIYTRTLDRTDESFPDVVRQLQTIDAEFLIDGEIVPWRDGRALPFAVLQKRLGRKKVSARQMLDAPARFVAFDLLYLDGQLLMDEPLVERQRRLRELAARFPELIVLPSSIVTTADEVAIQFERAREAGNEGLMLKSPGSPYSPGRRGGQWLKLKTHLPTLDCVVTAAEYGHGKRRGVLSDYTFAVRDGDRLLNIGKAYSGVTDQEIAELTQLFMSISTSNNGRVFQVEPQVVLEIAFDQILESKRHASGFAMRFPRIKRVRWDKKTIDADTLGRVKDIYHSPANLGRKAEAPVATEPTLFDGL